MPNPPGVSSLLQRRVVELAGEAKLGFKGEPLADGGINPAAVGPPELGVVGHRLLMLHLIVDSCLSNGTSSLTSMAMTDVTGCLLASGHGLISKVMDLKGIPVGYE